MKTQEELKAMLKEINFNCGDLDKVQSNMDGLCFIHNLICMTYDAIQNNSTVAVDEDGHTFIELHNFIKEKDNKIYVLEDEIAELHEEATDTNGYTFAEYKEEIDELRERLNRIYDLADEIQGECQD